MKSKKYREYNPSQVMLLPPSLHDWLNSDHLVYFVMDLVKQLDLSAIEDGIQSKDPRGNRPYAPVMMVALLIYAWCVGVRSSRKIERLTVNDVAFRVVAANTHPTFSTLALFRRTHNVALAGLFTQVVQVARKAGLAPLKHVAVDGSKVQAAASKHQAMSHERMQMTEEKLEREIARILEEAEETDHREDDVHGQDNNGSGMPPELARRETRLARIKQAIKELEAEARKARATDLREQAEAHREKAETAEKPTDRKRATTLAKKRAEAADELDPPSEENGSDGDPPFMTPEGLPMNRPPRKPDGTPKPKAQRNFTDPDSRIMEKGGAFLQGYNCQAAVDEAHQIIVGHAVTNMSPDNGNLVPMLEQVESSCGRVPDVVTADTGYWNADVEQACSALGTDAYIATKRINRGEPPSPMSDDPLPDDAGAKERMRAKLNTAEGRDIYRKRKSVVEPVFGQIKDARGLVRFLRKGMAAVSEDWGFECTCHNVLKVYRAGWRAATTPG